VTSATRLLRLDGNLPRDGSGLHQGGSMHAHAPGLPPPVPPSRAIPHLPPLPPFGARASGSGYGTPHPAAPSSSRMRPSTMPSPPSSRPAPSRPPPSRPVPMVHPPPKPMYRGVAAATPVPMRPLPPPSPPPRRPPQQHTPVPYPSPPPPPAAPSFGIDASGMAPAGTLPRFPGYR
jgi:hypothetical protein